jgi:ubiquinone biosynthesis protein COQ4
MSIVAEESTRIRPLVAWRALRALLRNGEDTKQVFIIRDALRGRSGQRAFERFRATELGRAVLAGKQGTLGRVYHDFMAEENLTADGLVEASNAAGGTPVSSEVRLFRERGRDQHDLHHVVTGYGRNGLGEVCLLTFNYAQNRNRGLGVIALAGAIRTARALPGQPVWRCVAEAYRHGKAAARLMDQDWEALIAEPLAPLRGRLGIQEPVL